MKKTLIIFIALLFTTSGWGQFKNILVSQSMRPKPEEVTIAINPANPQNLAAGANIDYYYYSNDGGMSWNEGRLTSTLGVYGDPCVAFDGNGNLYFGHLSNPVEGHWIDRIVVQKSEDGGESWNDGAGVGYLPFKNQDKEWIAVDLTNSQYYNSIYMAWTEFDSYGSRDSNDSTRILFSYSRDAGNLWADPIVVSDHGGNCIDDDDTVEGAVPTVGPNGEVYLSWSGPLGIMFDKSTDGGKTFGKDVFVTSQPGGWNFRVSGIMRCNGFPVTCCDVSNSQYRGHIYIMWSDQRNGTDNTDVFLIKSVDGGKSWGNIRRVNDDDSGRHQFFSWMTIDQSTGYIYIVFYDRRNTRGDDTEVYMARSTDGGDTFKNIKISELPFFPTSSVFFGDYINIAAMNGNIYPIWTRMDNGELSVWTAIVEEASIDVQQDDQPALTREFQLLQNYPNPFNAVTEIGFRIEKKTSVAIDVYNVTGEFVRHLEHGYFRPGQYSVKWDGRDHQNHPASSGVYMYHLKTDYGEQSKKMLLLL